MKYYFDCHTLSPDEYRKFYSEVHAVYDFVDCDLRNPRCFYLTLTDRDPRPETTVKLPPGCRMRLHSLIE